MVHSAGTPNSVNLYASGTPGTVLSVCCQSPSTTGSVMCVVVHFSGTSDTVLCVCLHSQWHSGQCAMCLKALHLHLWQCVVCVFLTQALYYVWLAEHSVVMGDTQRVPRGSMSAHSLLGSTTLEFGGWGC